MSHKVAELQHNQIKSIISNDTTRFSSNRANLLCFSKEIICSLPPSLCDYQPTAQCILHFPVFDTLFDNEGMCYITVLLGLLDQSPILQHINFRERRSKRRSSMVFSYNIVTILYSFSLAFVKKQKKKL